MGCRARPWWREYWSIRPPTGSCGLLIGVVDLGGRVRVFDRYHKPGAVRDGTIKDRSWGRERGKPIWWFTVDLDDFPGEGWVFGPGELNAPDAPDSTGDHSQK
jgi:hypothetical protein